MTQRVMPGMEGESWYENDGYGYEISDLLWQRYKEALAAVGEIEQEMDDAPFVDDRPPLTDDQTARPARCEHSISANLRRSTSTPSGPATGR